MVNERDENCITNYVKYGCAFLFYDLSDRWKLMPSILMYILQCKETGLANRKNISAMSAQDLAKLRQLLDSYINGPNKPVDEHKKAGKKMSMMIHDIGFLAWHQYFVAKLEHWLVTNNNADFVPLPYWDPADPIPSQLNKNNTNVNKPLPPNLRQSALGQIASYTELTNRILPYHADVHDNSGGNMPNPEKSPSDPIFWPFHSFLLSVYEQWRNL